MAETMTLGETLAKGLCRELHPDRWARIVNRPEPFEMPCGRCVRISFNQAADMRAWMVSQREEIAQILAFEADSTHAYLYLRDADAALAALTDGALRVAPVDAEAPKVPQIEDVTRSGGQMQQMTDPYRRDFK